jgi:hypothetical protein
MRIRYAIAVAGDELQIIQPALARYPLYRFFEKAIQRLPQTETFEIETVAPQMKYSAVAHGPCK